MFKVQFAVHLTDSHNDSAPTPFEFNIYVFRELKAENGASFIAAIQSPTVLPFQYMGKNSAIHNPTVSNSIGLPGIEQQAGTGKLIQNVNRIPAEGNMTLNAIAWAGVSFSGGEPRASTT